MYHMVPRELQLFAKLNLSNVIYDRGSLNQSITIQLKMLCSVRISTPSLLSSSKWTAFFAWDAGYLLRTNNHPNMH